MHRSATGIKHIIGNRYRLEIALRHHFDTETLTCQSTISVDLLYVRKHRKRYLWTS